MDNSKQYKIYAAVFTAVSILCIWLASYKGRSELGSIAIVFGILAGRLWGMSKETTQKGKK